MMKYASITAEKAGEIQSFTRMIDGVIPCDCTAGTLLSWCAPQGGSVRLDERWLSAFWPKSGMLGFPLLADGSWPTPGELLAEVESFHATGVHLNVVIDVPVDWAEANRAAIEQWCSLELSRIGQDYIYAATDLAALPGAKYAAKRNLIHQFEREHPCWHVKPLSSGDLANPRLKRFIDEWHSTASDPSGSLSNDLIALEAAFRHWDTGIFQGLAIYADDVERGPDALLAFSVFSTPTHGMADVHFEKAAHDVKGASQLINRETARRLLNDGVVWINREQDMGVPGLRKAKTQYHPALLLPTCVLRLL